MWIRSQDKKILVNVEKFIIGYNANKKVYEIHNDYDSLGIYKSKERALEVLDEIHDEISNYVGTMAQIVYEMPEE